LADSERKQLYSSAARDHNCCHRLAVGNHPRLPPATVPSFSELVSKTKVPRKDVNHEERVDVLARCAAARALRLFEGECFVRFSRWLNVISALVRHSSWSALSSSSVRSSIAANLFSAPFIARTSSDSFSWIAIVSRFWVF